MIRGNIPNLLPHGVATLDTHWSVPRPPLFSVREHKKSYEPAGALWPFHLSALQNHDIDSLYKQFVQPLQVHRHGC